MIFINHIPENDLVIFLAIESWKYMPSKYEARRVAAYLFEYREWKQTRKQHVHC